MRTHSLKAVWVLGGLTVSIGMALSSHLYSYAQEKVEEQVQANEQTPSEEKMQTTEPVIAESVVEEKADVKSEESESLEYNLTESQNVTLDFKDADIRNVLKIVSYKAGINIVATPEVRGNVTLKLNDVPWEKALDTIVRTYDFGYEWISPTVIMVSTLERLAQQRKAQQEAQEMEPLDTQTFVLNFSKAADIKAAIEKLVSPRGKITLETRANTLIITDTKSNLMKIATVIKALDRVTLQVMIEAKIVEVTLAAAEKLGIDWTMKFTARGAKRPTTIPFDAKGGSGDDWMSTIFPKSRSSSDNDANRPYAFPFPKPDYTSGAIQGDFSYGTLDFSQFQAVLEILKSRSDTKIISNPRVTTLNNQEAKILVGTIIPIPLYEFSKEAGTMVIAGYKDQEIGVRLVVTPNINEQSYISLNIKPNVDEIIGFTGPNNERPIISTRNADAKVMIKDGQTLVMGGLISEKKIKVKRGVPILRDLPVLEYVFGKKEDTLDRTELLIFITPHIVKEGEFTPDGVKSLEEGMGKLSEIK